MSSTTEKIGWREWLELPDLNITKIKAKIDTGARSSALHAVRLKAVEEEGETYIHFEVHPSQRDSKTVIKCKAKLVEYRNVKSSVGQITKRPVIETDIHGPKMDN